jgi:hypothetical protein
MESRCLLSGYNVTLNGSFEIGTSIAGEERDYTDIANFQARDPSGHGVSDASGFSASVDWGDGTTTDGTIEDYPGVEGLFEINASHAYPNPSNGEYNAQVTLTDPGGGQWVGPPSIATVDPRPDELVISAPPGGDVFSVNVGQDLSGPIAVVTVADPNANVTGLTGDVFNVNTGQENPVTVVPLGPDQFDIEDPDPFNTPGDDEFDLELDDDEGDQAQESFQVIVKPKVLPDIVPTSLYWDANDSGATFSYDINNAPLPRKTTVELEWVKVSGGMATILARPLYYVVTGTAVSSYGPFTAPGSALRTPPPGTTHLRVLCDPGNQVQESNENNNALLIPVKPTKGPLPDLVGAGFSYIVPSTALLVIPVDGPLPVNEPFQLSAKITNKGAAKAGASVVKIYLSTDSTITAGDLLIAQIKVPALDPGFAYTIKDQQLSLPANLPLKYFGTVYLGMVVDATNTVRESNENNNSNQGNNIDRTPVRLFDPIAPEDRISSFASSQAADQYLTNHGFAAPVLIGDSGWSRSVPNQQRIFSRFNGQYMPGSAFREQAAPFFSPRIKRWAINMQGSDSSYNPVGHKPVMAEPNPRTAASFGAQWFAYVLEYHLDF